MATIVNTRDVELQATSPRVAGIALNPNIEVDPDQVTGLGLVLEGTKQVKLAASSQIFQIPKAGATSPASIILTANLYNIVATPTLTIKPGSGTMSVVPSLDVDGTFTFTPAQLTSDVITFVLTAVEGGNDYVDEMTVCKVREGIDSLTAFLTNETHTLGADYLGNVTDYSGASGKFKVFQGINDVTTVCTFALVSGGNPDNLTYSLTASGVNAGNFAVTGNYPVAKDVTTLTFRATFGTTTVDKVFTISKAKAGVNGATAQALALKPNAQTFNFNGADVAVPATQTITFTAVQQNLTGVPGWTAQAFDATGGSLGSVALGGSGAARTMTNAQFVAPGAVNHVVVTVTWDGFTDTTTIYKLKDGVDSVVGYLTNEACVIATAADGTGGNYASAGGTFKVFDGIVDKTGAGPTYSLQSSSGVTVSINATTGVYTVSNASADIGSAVLRAVYAGRTIDKTYSIAKSKQGTGGAQGSNAATVYLFQRTATSTAPAKPSVNVTYTFATGVATGMNNGWTQTMPATGGSYRWMTTASALGTGATDTIASSEWATVANVSQDGDDGADGIDGNDGMNSALVYIYQRAASTPTLPSATTTYTFATGGLTGLNNGWTRTIPAGTNPLYVSVATAASTAPTDTIAAGEWAAAVILARDGQDGADGGDGVPGQRGSRWFYVALAGSGNVWSDSIATTAASEDGGPVLRDTVTEFNNSQGFSETRFWTGTSWAVVNAVVDGNLLVDGTIGTDALIANSVTSVKIDSRNLSIKDAAGNVVFDANTLAGTDSASTFGFNPRFSAWSGTYPVGYSSWSGSAPVKETTVTLQSPYSVKYTTTAATNQGIQRTYQFLEPLTAGTYVSGAVTIYMDTYVSGGKPGYLIRLFTSSDLSTWVDTKVEIVDQTTTDGWQRIPFIAGANGLAIHAIRVYQMASWSSMTGGHGGTGNVILFGPFTFEVRNPITSANATVFMENAAINIAQINTASITNLSALSATVGLLRTATTGGRVEIQDTGSGQGKITVYDTTNAVRVKIGYLL